MRDLILLMGVVLCMVGCKTPNRMPMADYDPQPGVKYAPVSVIVNDGQINNATTYTEYAGTVTVVDPCAFRILSDMQKCGIFESVDANNEMAEIVFLITFGQNLEDSIPEFALKLTGSILTLYMVPFPYDYIYKMDVAVRYRNEIIANYCYEEPLRDYYFFFEHVYDDYEKMIAVMMSKLYHDLQKDQLLEPYQPSPVWAQNRQVQQ